MYRKAFVDYINIFMLQWASVNRKEIYMAKINKLGQYKGIEVHVQKQEVTQEEIDQQIQAIVAQSSTLIEKEGTVENGDVTTIDFEGFKDGVAFDGGKAENYQLEIGSGSFIPGFEDQMIGMEKGETRELNLTFPQNYGAQELAGADVIFKVTVHKIEIKKEAELNDEFVARLNVPNLKTVEDFKNQVKANIQAQHEQTYRTAVENSIMEKLIKDCDVEVSEEDIQKAMEQHILHIKNELAQQGMQLEQYLQMVGMSEDVLRQQLEPTARQQASFEAIIDEIVNVENIVTSDEEANEQVEYIANHNQISKEEVLEKVDFEGLKHDLNRLKASQLIISSAVISN